MSISLKEVRESALLLSKPSRKKLLCDLISSLEKNGEKNEIDWIAQAEARIDAYDRGELETISLDQFLKHIDRPSHGNKARQRRKAGV